MKSYVDLIITTVPQSEVETVVRRAVDACANKAGKIAGDAAAEARKLMAVDESAVLAEATRQKNVLLTKSQKVCSTIAPMFHVTPRRIGQILSKHKWK